MGYRHFEPTRWTRPLQFVTAGSSLVFTIGTAVHNFVIVDLEMMQHTMRLAGMSAAQAGHAAPGFLLGFRLVGCLFILANALGVLALRGWAWVFWLAIVVNSAQAAGVVVVPPEAFESIRDRYGPAGLLPSLSTDGGALLSTLILLFSLAVYRTAWARRVTDPGTRA